ncbi:MAG: hypothetical protein COA78_22040 [Blastopirellula sp.]|nr:MAG: hypothetical protein COA78_22040 [Blastopirellula sp.]
MNRDLIKKYKKEFDAWIKPEYRIIGNIECPMPLTSLDGLELVFAYSVNSSELFHKITVDVKGNDYEKMYLERGLLFANKEDAIATTKAILKLLELPK